MIDAASFEKAVLPLALEAGEATMAVRNRAAARGGIETERKADASPVTEADLAADRILVSGLEAAFPGIPLVTEERAATHDAEAAGDRFFLIDPLDGTKEFVKGGTDFTVNVALIEGGRPTLGIVHVPADGRSFWTGADGPRMRGADGAERALQVADAGGRALRVVASKSHRDAATDAYIARYEVAGFEAAGSSLKFCLLAAAEADLYPRLGRTMEWDTAAGHAVLAAAGGTVDRLEGGPLTYGKPGFENPFFVAYARGVTPIPEASA